MAVHGSISFCTKQRHKRNLLKNQANILVACCIFVKLSNHPQRTPAPMHLQACSLRGAFQAKVASQSTRGRQNKACLEGWPLVKQVSGPEEVVTCQNPERQTHIPCKHTLQSSSSFGLAAFLLSSHPSALWPYGPSQSPVRGSMAQHSSAKGAAATSCDKHRHCRYAKLHKRKRKTKPTAATTSQYHVHA